MVEPVRTDAHDGNAQTPTVRTTALTLSARILTFDNARSLWAGFSADDLFGVAQSLLWVATWAECVNPKIIVAALFDGDNAVLLLPLEIVHQRGARIARYIGGTHANANFPVMRREYATSITAADIVVLFQEIRTADPKLDAVLLTRQLMSLLDVANPMLALRTIESPNLALSFVITSDFETLIKDRSGARKLKKMRQQGRRMDERGGWRCVVAHDDASVDAILDSFFVMKAKRFEEFGLKDTFKASKIRDFFKTLFRLAAQSPHPIFQLDALDVGGEILAVAGSSIRHRRNIVEFGAVRAHEPTLSPGDFLFHQMIKKAVDNEYTAFDFGVGDEAYKRAWCDIETRHADSMIGFTLRGSIYITLFRWISVAKLTIKRNQFLTAQLKKWRMRNAPKVDTASSD